MDVYGFNTEHSSVCCWLKCVYVVGTHVCTYYHHATNSLVLSLSHSFLSFQNPALAFSFETRTAAKATKKDSPLFFFFFFFPLLSVSPTSGACLPTSALCYLAQRKKGKIWKIVYKNKLQLLILIY